MEDFLNGMEHNLPYFQINSTLDFDHGIYTKIHTDSDEEYSYRNAQHLFYYLSTNHGISVACIASTVYRIRIAS